LGGDVPEPQAPPNRAEKEDSEGGERKPVRMGDWEPDQTRKKKKGICKRRVVDRARAPGEKKEKGRGKQKGASSALKAGMERDKKEGKKRAPVGRNLPGQGGGEGKPAPNIRKKGRERKTIEFTVNSAGRKRNVPGRKRWAGQPSASISFSQKTERKRSGDGSSTIFAPTAFKKEWGEDSESDKERG